MLRILINSVIINNNYNNSHEFEFQFTDYNKITGIWKNDKDFISIIKENNGPNPILIMGLGPSASGKTYWVEQILKLLKNKSKNSIKDKIPDYFLSIDGGLFREYSKLYQKIIEYIKNIKNIKIAGIKSLVSSSFIATKLFDSEKIKPIIIKFLEKEKQNIYFGLYVPETLSICSYKNKMTLKFISSCGNLIDKYNNILNNKKFIPILIYQHLNKDKNSICKFEKEYKCIGCYQSGKNREKKEGKIYSDNSYKLSLKEGFKILNYKNTLTKLIIHNSGGRKYFNENKFKESKSIIIELYNNNNNNKIIKTNNINNINDNNQFKYIQIEDNNFKELNNVEEKIMQIK